MKKVLLVLLALIMVLSMMTTAIAMPSGKIPPGQMKQMEKFTNQFEDLMGYDWASEEIQFMAEKGVIKGVGNGRFVPNRPAKEIEVIIMLLRLIDDEEGLDMEADLPDDYEGGEYDEWMIPYISLAEEEDVLTKEGLKKINPNSAASREEVAMYIMMALDAFNLETNDDIEGNLEELFEDADNVDQEYLGYVHRIRMNNLMIGYNGKFQPKKAITRAELAVLMNRIFTNFELDWIDYDNGQETTTGILTDFDYDSNTTLASITLDDDIDFDDIDEDVEIIVENNCNKDAEDEIDELDEDKHVDLEVELTLEDGTVVEILVSYEELEGELEYDANLDDNGSVDIIPEGETESEDFDFDEDIEIFMNGEEISESEFEDFDMDEDIDYEIEARLLGNGDIINLCITYED
jgi:hypothetical protein